MLSHSIYSVISPEGCASILWKTADKAEQASEALALTADKLQKMGIVGVMFQQLGWMVTIIMTVSTATALTLTPMMSSQLLRLNPKRSKAFEVVYLPFQKALDKLDIKYAQFVNWAVRHRWTMVIIASVFFLVSLLPAGFIGTDYIPAQDSGRISATVNLPVGTRMEITKQVAAMQQFGWYRRSNL
jgi:HAE1 family hydrophobic/amphiphilic exporter-1